MSQAKVRQLPLRGDPRRHAIVTAWVLVVLAHATAPIAQAGPPVLKRLTLSDTSHVCDPVGLGAIDGPPPHNFPGADAAVMDFYRPLDPGLVEAAIPPGRNPAVARVFGTDVGFPHEHRDGRLYLQFGDSSFPPEEGIQLVCPPDGSPCSLQIANNDVLASTSQTALPNAQRCLNLAIEALARDPTQFAPVTLNGYARDGGAFLGPAALPGPGFSTGEREFAQMPVETGILCTLNEAGNDCASVGGIEGDQCIPVFGPGFGLCYFGECGADPSSPCALRLNPATLGVRESGSAFLSAEIGVDVTSQAVLDAYRGHFSTVTFFSQVDFATGDGKVWAIGRDSFWGATGITMDPYLLYHPVQDGVLGEPQYFAGLDAANKPVFSPERSAARTLYEEDKLINNHTSFAYLPELDGGTWVMIYGGRAQTNIRSVLELFVRPLTDAQFYDTSSGIALRWAKQPWGPWSEAITIFNPFVRGHDGYCKTMHFEDPEQKTGFSCPAALSAHNERLNRYPDVGLAGEYGAALLPRFTRWDRRSNTLQIHWLMSTWNPYRVVLMRSELSARFSAR